MTFIFAIILFVRKSRIKEKKLVNTQSYYEEIKYRPQLIVIRILTILDFWKTKFQISS